MESIIAISLCGFVEYNLEYTSFSLLSVSYLSEGVAMPDFISY